MKESKKWLAFCKYQKRLLLYCIYATYTYIFFGGGKGWKLEDKVDDWDGEYIARQEKNRENKKRERPSDKWISKFFLLTLCSLSKSVSIPLRFLQGGPIAVKWIRPRFSLLFSSSKVARGHQIVRLKLNTTKSYEKGEQKLPGLE